MKFIPLSFLLLFAGAAYIVLGLFAGRPLVSWLLTGIGLAFLALFLASGRIMALRRRRLDRPWRADS